MGLSAAAARGPGHLRGDAARGRHGQPRAGAAACHLPPSARNQRDVMQVDKTGLIMSLFPHSPPRQPPTRVVDHVSSACLPSLWLRAALLRKNSAASQTVVVETPSPRNQRDGQPYLIIYLPAISLVVETLCKLLLLRCTAVHTGVPIFYAAAVGAVRKTPTGGGRCGPH